MPTKYLTYNGFFFHIKKVKKSWPPSVTYNLIFGLQNYMLLVLLLSELCPKQTLG